MTRTKSTFLALLAVLLSPIAANADLVTYTGNSADDDDGSYLQIVAELTGTAEGVYSLGAGLTSYVMTAFDMNGAIQGLVDSNNPLFDTLGFAQFIQFDAAGLVIAWEILGYYTDNSSGSCFSCWSGFNSSFGDWDRTGTADIYNPGTWAVASVPEPGTLALLGIGLFGMGLARRKKV